ncbi:unnamed protein product [Bursaphelenchus okinawaensis]|uniref:Uncharacterized protein n=1 Tax=Bursaphelenchus okinawaensis TaxID=465554 RepID=A0A811L3S1_9BILA|nr:unnamed protein product [Bursaphelenchus okinawaensis]CAG9118725.1 unnamed protein product [Bursaphelenchus okinawaensis]
MGSRILVLATELYAIKHSIRGGFAAKYSMFVYIGVTVISFLLTIPFKRNLAVMYNGNKFNLHSKTMISIQLRSLSILKSTLWISLLRMALCLPLIIYMIQFMIPACQITESRYAGLTHDIIFEFCDILVNIWIMKEEPMLKKQISWLNNRTVTPMRNALGQDITIENGGDKHFEDLMRMWEHRTLKHLK